MQPQLRSRYERDLKLRGSRPGTVQTYIRAVELFLERACPNQDPSRLTLDEVLAYQLYLLEEKGDAPATVNVNMAAIGFFSAKRLG